MTKYLLADRELNGYNDSDFYAVFWDTETESIRSEMYGTTRCAAPTVAPADEYLRDIPDDVLEKAKAYLFQKMSDRIREEDRILVDEPAEVSRGDVLEILESGSFRDRDAGVSIKYEAGEQGEVIWRGAFGTFYANGYNRVGRHNLRVGLKLSDGRTVFLALKKCKLARPYLSDEEISRRAQAHADGLRFHALSAVPGFIQF